MESISDTWDCGKCTRTVSGTGKFFWYLCGDLVVRFRCPDCKKRRDRKLTAEELSQLETSSASGSAANAREDLAVQLKMKRMSGKQQRANRKSLRKYRRQFLRELKRNNHLAEIAREEGDWRTS